MEVTANSGQKQFKTAAHTNPLVSKTSESEGIPGNLSSIYQIAPIQNVTHVHPICSVSPISSASHTASNHVFSRVQPHNPQAFPPNPDLMCNSFHMPTKHTTATN